MQSEGMTEKQDVQMSDPMTIHEQNVALKKELWSRGYYVNEINACGGIEYLVVSCCPPKPQFIFDHTSN